eukprot:9009621-Alexandrium_andersonii.AAC.1
MNSGGRQSHLPALMWAQVRTATLLGDRYPASSPRLCRFCLACVVGIAELLAITAWWWLDRFAACGRSPGPC